MKRMLTAVAATALVCGGCFLTSDEVGSRYIKAVDITAAAGATITVSESESAELAGTRLAIPPGALARDTRITLALDRDAIVQAPHEPAGPVAEWGPPGTVFSRTVQMTLPYRLTGAQPVESLYVEILEDDGTVRYIDRPRFVANGSTGVVNFEASGFSRFQAGIHHCPSSHPCPEGTQCHEGRCQNLPCGATPCPHGEACVASTCVPACGATVCPHGQTCCLTECHDLSADPEACGH